jgi:hypothetical protein
VEAPHTKMPERCPCLRTYCTYCTTDSKFLNPPPLRSNGATAPSGPGPPHYCGFMVTLRHTTLHWTQDEWSPRRKDSYLTTHNTHRKQTSMPLSGIPTHNPSKWTAADPLLRPWGHWDQPKFLNTVVFTPGWLASTDTYYFLSEQSVLFTYSK